METKELTEMDSRRSGRRNLHLAATKDATRRISVRRARPFLGLAFALAGVFAASGVAQAASYEGAYAQTAAGGRASTFVITSPAVRGLEVRAYLTQQSGGSQTVGAALHLYSEPTGAWLDFPWETVDTMSVAARTGATVYFTHAWQGLPAGRYYIRMDYAWYTTSGWVTIRRDFGWLRL